jgi:hypothetical protein
MPFHSRMHSVAAVMQLPGTSSGSKSGGSAVLDKPQVFLLQMCAVLHV